MVDAHDPWLTLPFFERVVFFNEKFNQTNFLGCITVFLGVIMYKVQFHLAKKHSKGSGDDSISSKNVMYSPVRLNIDGEDGDDDQDAMSCKARRASILEFANYRKRGSSDDTVIDENGEELRVI